MLKYLVTTIITIVLFVGCGGSRQGSDEGLTDEEKQQQQNLNEIEALLGISGGDAQTQGQTTQQTTPSGKQNEDMLGLLGANEMVDDSQPEAKPADNAQVKSMEKELTTLKSQVREKDLIIADLKAQIDFQNEQLEKQSFRRPAASGAGGYTGPIDDVAPGEYQQRYQESLDNFHSGNYNHAIELFESLLASSSTNSLSDNAQYWIGESHYALRQYDAAIVAFHKVFTFPKSNKNPDAQFKIGLCYLRKGDTAKAKEEFNRLLSDYPNSEYTSRARKHIESL
jgi:tol-pal system protein YbgF